MGGAIGCCLGHPRASQAPVPVLKDLWGNLSLWSKPACPWGQWESREAGKPCLSLARPVGPAALLLLRRLVTPPQNAVPGTNSSDDRYSFSRFVAQSFYEFPDHAAELNKVQVCTDQDDSPQEDDSRTFGALVNTKARGICSIKSGGKEHNLVRAGFERDAAKERKV